MPPSDAPRAAVATDGRGAPTPRERPLVLAVDDDAAVLTLVRRVLSAYEVVDFDRPDAALAALRGGLVPDLMLSDVQMPVMSGFELHVEVRRLPRLRAVPFVYLTALDRRDDVRHGMALGADDYLTKPFRPDELRAAVAARLARRHAFLDAPDEPAPRGLVLATLGGLSLTSGEQRLTWEAKRVVLLLAYLLDLGGRARVAQVRADLLDPGSAPNLIHVLTSRLRRTLGDLGGVAVVDDEVHLRLGTEIAWDAATFARLAERALTGREPEAIEAALALYGGPSLSDFDGPWVDAHRARLDDLHFALLEAAVAVAPDDAERQRAEARLAAALDD
ncbi:MAG: response regulator [Trueperaceae bacterium]|nr:response regulator [Trueperaceae bacterium]